MKNAIIATIAIVIIAIIGLLVFFLIFLARAEDKKEKEKKPDADRDAIKREILEELKAQGLKPVRRKLTTRQKWAIALFSLQIVGYAGWLVQVGENVLSALAQAIGASVFMIIGAILLFTEKKVDK